MSDFIRDGDFTVAEEISVIRSSAPIKVLSDLLLFEVDLMIDADFFVELPLNTAHPLIPDSYLVQETPRRDIGNGLVQWTRIYAKIPPTWDDGGSMNYHFVGYIFGNTSGSNTEARDSFVDAVPVRLQKDYFLVGDGGYDSILDIPLLQAQEYYGVGGPGYPVRMLGGISTPTKDDYIEMIGTEIVAENSSLAHWNGNIWERTTPYIIAK